MTTLAEAAILMRAALRDRSYQGTPLGFKVRDYLAWKQDGGASPHSQRDYETTLARLALEHADLDVASLEGQDGRRLVEGWWRRAWSDAEPSTRAKRLAHLKDFFRWLEGEDGSLVDNRVRLIRAPRKAEADHGILFTADEQARLYQHTHGRDHVAIHLLFSLALRQSALRLFQLGDYDRDRARARFHWKGQRTHVLPVTPRLAMVLDEHVDQRMAEAAAEDRDYRLEYLLYPTKRGPSWNPDLPKIRTLWEDRLQPLSPPSIHAWWYSCLQDAGIVDPGVTSGRKMHAGRHTGISDKIRKGMPIEQAQLLAGHKSIATTVNIYGHVDVSDLASTLEGLDEA